MDSLVSKFRQLPNQTHIIKEKDLWIGYLNNNRITDPDIGTLVDRLLTIAIDEELIDG